MEKNILLLNMNLQSFYNVAERPVAWHLLPNNVNEIMKTKFNITSVFSAEKLNGNSAKQLL